jgi:hypothetical protein
MEEFLKLDQFKLPWQSTRSEAIREKPVKGPPRKHRFRNSLVSEDVGYRSESIDINLHIDDFPPL